MNFFKKAKKGFTLVELVVVIAVIAILAAVSVGAYFGVTESANNSRAEQEAKQAYTQLQTKTLAGLDLGGSSKVELMKDGLVFTGLYNSDILSVMNGSVFEEQGVNYDVVAATGDVSTLEGVSENATVYFFGEKNESSGTVFSKYMGYVPANLAKKYVKYIELGNGSFVDSTALTGNYSEEVLPSNMVKHVITLDKFSNYNVKNNAYRYIGSYAIPSEVTYDAITVTNQNNIDNNEIQLNRKNNGGIYLTNNELGKIFSIAFEWADNESNNLSDKIRFKGTTYEKYSVTSKDDVIVPSTETNIGELQYPNKFMTVDGNIYYGKIDTVDDNATYLDSITVYYEKGNVPVKVNGIEFDLENTIFETGTSVQINATVSPVNALDKTLTWSSSDETIATVDQNGLVSSKGIDAEGTVEITATSNENPNISQTVSISFKKVVNYSFGMANNLSNLTNGSKILIGNRENNMVIGTASTNYFNEKSITDISEDLSDFNASFNNLTDIEVITLEVIDSSLSAEHAGKYALKLSNGKYVSYDSKASSNYLYEKDLVDSEGIVNAFAIWNISFDGECNAIIENVGAPTRLVRYNKGSTRFSTYVGSSNQLPVQIFVDGYVTNTNVASFEITTSTTDIIVNKSTKFEVSAVYPSFAQNMPSEITWNSSNADAGSFTGSVFKASKADETTIINATIVIDGQPITSSNSITLNIIEDERVNGYYELTDLEEFNNASKVVLVSSSSSKGVGLKSTDDNKYLIANDVTKDLNKITFNDLVNEFTIEKTETEGNVYLKDKNNLYLKAEFVGTYSALKLGEKDQGAIWSITFNQMVLVSFLILKVRNIIL